MDNIWHDLLRVREDAMLAIGLVIAIGVTIHILLRKREVASAVGWIGLVWFAPIPGAIAYSVLGVNRVKRRARKLRMQDRNPRGRSRRPMPRDSNMAVLGRGIGRMTARSLVADTTVQAYQNGDEAYPRMLQAIAEAKVSVGLSSYIFRDDSWGGRFVEALADAHARGVAVRVLIDGIGGGWLRSPVYRRLVKKNVLAARFMHSLLPWRMPFLNLRSHKKILVVDGVIGFTGGMNIADDNVLSTRPKNAVQDVHFRIEGPVVAQLVDAFAQDWLFATDEDLEGETWWPKILPDINASPSPLARVIDSGPDEDLEKLEFAVLEAVACARSSIAVMTPYFLPDERLITALSLAAMRGVTVDLMMPETSDHVLVDWATRANIGPLLTDGAHIWLSASPFHHTKMMVVDGEWCLVGSCNWDIRSFRLNFELCVEIYDRALATILLALMEHARGPELTKAMLDGRSLPVCIRDAAARLLLPYL